MPVGNLVGAMAARVVDADYAEWGWYLFGVGALLWLALWPITFLMVRTTRRYLHRLVFPASGLLPPRAECRASGWIFSAWGGCCESGLHEPPFVLSSPSESSGLMPSLYPSLGPGLSLSAYLCLEKTHELIFMPFSRNLHIACALAPGLLDSCVRAFQSIDNHHSDPNRRNFYGVWVAPPAVAMMAYANLSGLSSIDNVQRILFCEYGWDPNKSFLHFSSPVPGRVPCSLRESSSLYFRKHHLQATNYRCYLAN